MSGNLHSRRTLLKQGLFGAAAAIGLGAGGVTLARKGGDAEPQPVPAQAESSRTLHLTGKAWTLTTPGRRLGEAIRPGDSSTVHGQLLDRHGKQVGSFLGQRTAAPTAVGAFTTNAALELHTFLLDEGTILGMGTSLPDDAGVFAVVGGSGLFAGARGSYTARQGIPELGGDGTAAFELTLLIQSRRTDGNS